MTDDFEEELKALLAKHKRAIVCAVVPRIVDVKEEKAKE